MARVAKRVESKPYTYKCAYCNYTDDELYYMKRHVSGIKYTKNERTYLRLYCSGRFAREKAMNPKIKKNSIPLSYSRPDNIGIYPYAIIIKKEDMSNAMNDPDVPKDLVEYYKQ